MPGLLCIGAACLDYSRIFDRHVAEAKFTASILREHALKVLDTNELLVRELDQRVRHMTWDQIRADRNVLAAESRSIMRDYSQIAATGLTDRNGIEWLVVTPTDTPQPPAGLSVTDREFWSGHRDADRGTLITAPYLGSLTGLPSFAVSRRRTTADGSFDGTVHVAVLISYFTDFWNSVIRLHPRARIALVRADGLVLAHIPPETLETQLPQDSPLVQRLPSIADLTEYTAKSSTDGVECIYIAAKIGNYKLYLTYGIPVASVVGYWLQQLMVLAAVCLLAALALAGTVLLAMHQARDLHEEQVRRAAVEKSALEAQRLEVLGQLAAGVAHDFGNLVQAVEFGASVIVRGANEDKMREAGQRIQQAARQGRWLTRRMMDFARQNDGVDEADAVLEPTETVSDIARFLTTTLGAQHQLTCTIVREGLPTLLRGDRSGLEGTIMNLALNARDAMPDGGEVVIRLEAHCISTLNDPANPARLAPGVYAAISVSDAGCGMPPAVLARASEPFFTTKPRGRGTGLGLASARGYARRNGGGFHIDSVEGAGTTVRLWLPEATADQSGTEAPWDGRRA